MLLSCVLAGHTVCKRWACAPRLPRRPESTPRMHATFARKHKHKHTLTRALGLAALRDRSRQMVREASERQGLDRWDAAATVAWLGDLAALCDEGGALVVSAVIEDGGVELLMRILRRMSIPDGGWRQAGRDCLRILAIMVECRAALGVRSAHELDRKGREREGERETSILTNQRCAERQRAPVCARATGGAARHGAPAGCLSRCARS